MASIEPEIHPGTPDLDETEMHIISLIQNGLPLLSRPYAAIGEQAGMEENEVIDTITGLIHKGVIKRYGVVVQHRDLGYRANAMVVWDMPEEKLDSIPGIINKFPFITLCYRRPRKPPRWPYNLFCMIHGHDRETVMKKLEHMIKTCQWEDIPYDVLFSRRRFKQRGAHYLIKPPATSN